MRLFTALDLSENVLRNVTALIERLRPAARIQWSRPENLHITTKFIGEWPEERLQELKQALAAVEPRAPISVQISELGFFPNARAPRVFWCGIQALDLEALAAATERATASLGIAAENRPFSAHLTLARIKDRANLEPLRRAMTELPSLNFGRFEADRFFLYRSQLHSNGSVYTKLAEFPFSHQ